MGFPQANLPKIVQHINASLGILIPGYSRVVPMDQLKKLNKIVNQLVSATDPDEVKRVYKEWADTYDNDLDTFGYVAPRIGVRMLSQVVSDKNALVHDAGCGTGLVGSLLSQLGYRELHGSDFSSSMLEKATLSGRYSKLQTLDFSAPVDIASNVYDAVISIGVYTKSFNQHFIGEMVRIIRPAGHFVFTCRELYFGEVMDSVSSLLTAQHISKVSIEFDDYMKGQAASAYYIDIKKSV